MKKIYGLLILMALPVLLLAQGINFEHGTVNEALMKAKAENKLLFIDCYAVWCGPCKRMTKTVFLEEKVGKYFDENYIAIKVDVERGEGPSIKRKYGVSGLPGYVILDGDDNVIYRFTGSMPTERFLENLEKARVNNTKSNNIVALAQRYEQESDDEHFVRLYLNKLKESNSTGYTDVLEQYLKIQKNITESSKEMVELLANHNEQIIYGGKADEIIQRNFGSDAWKLYVRKDIREKFQKLPRKMVETSTNYAVAKKDTVMLDLVLNRASEAGARVDEQQRKRTYVFYYLQSGQGDKYKSMVYDDNEAFIRSVDVESLRNNYLKVMKKKAEGDANALATRPFSVRISQQISSMVYSYAQFADTKEDKEAVTRWMKVAYDIIPGESKIMSQYAAVLYLYGDNKDQAVKIMEDAYQAALKSDSKKVDGVKADLALMKANKLIILK